MTFAIVVLAAGKGTRLKSKRPKVLHEIGGKTLLRHVVDAAREILPAKDIHIVIGHQAEAVKSSLTGLAVGFVEQKEQRGTGDAVRLAAGALSGYDHLLVLSGDAPLVTREMIAQIRDFHLKQKAAMTILTATAADPFGYGRVIRKAPDSDEVLKIVEQKALPPELLRINEINAGLYAFARLAFTAHIQSLGTQNAHREFYLTDMAAILSGAGERVVALRTEDANAVLGANTIEEMMALDQQIRMRMARRLMASGVTIFRPDTSVIDAGVSIAPDTILDPFVQILGNTRIGEDCHIRSYSVLEDAVLGNGITVRQGSTITASEIHDGAVIGPYAHLRPESEIGEGAHVGNFVETKKTRLGKGSKANHLTYLGDSVIGSGVNIGAGVITCNYDGVTKKQTKIEDGAFIGSDSTLVAPVTVGRGAYVAAGSCITEDVPDDALALGRARQTVKENWASARRRKKQESGCLEGSEKR